MVKFKTFRWWVRNAIDNPSVQFLSTYLAIGCHREIVLLAPQISRGPLLTANTKKYYRASIATAFADVVNILSELVLHTRSFNLPGPDLLSICQVETTKLTLFSRWVVAINSASSSGSLFK